VLERIRGGEALGLAMIHEDVSEPTRRLLLGHFVAEELADGLDRHYVLDAAGEYEAAFQAEQAAHFVLESMARQRKRAQKIGALALIPFVGFLVLHGIYHEVPLFLASFRRLLCRLARHRRPSRMRSLALREARQEYAEYFFLFPLFLAITLLTAAVSSRA
jgi:hypothetical protein